MSEAAAVLPSETQPYIQIWSESLAQVIGQISGATIACVPLPEAPSDLASAADSDFWAVCACSGSLRGEMSLRMNAASALRLAQTFMSEPPTPEATLTPDHREAVVELLRQVAGIIATSIKARWGEVQLQITVATGAASWPASSSHWLKAGEDASAVFLEMNISAALAASLRDVQKPAAAPTPAGAEATPPADRKLHLLMDVELDMTLRFGSRHLQLREVLELTPGAVIELDRQVPEPVDLLLDGRLIARGEVVVMDGNYGLRVTEVLQANAG